MIVQAVKKKGTQHGLWLGVYTLALPTLQDRAVPSGFGWRPMRAPAVNMCIVQADQARCGGQ